MSTKSDHITPITSDLPDWCHQIFDQFEVDLERLHNLLRISMAGITLLPHRAGAIMALHNEADKYGQTERVAYENSLRQAERDEVFAKTEIENGFELLIAQSTVTLWNMLEAHIRSFVAYWLMYDEAAWQVEEVGKLKIKLGDFQSLDQVERCFWVVDLLDQEQSGPTKSGINRFEALLKPFGLSGNLAEEEKKNLHELCQMRHLLAHRNGVVDKKFKENCPWLLPVVGEKVVLTRKSWFRHMGAVRLYHNEIALRVYGHYGFDREKLLRVAKSLSEEARK